MANITPYINVIETASRGEEVRDSIVSALEAINTNESTLPTPTASDSGKVLSVNTSGNWTLRQFTSAEGVSF